MSLYKQLAILISALFIIMFAGTFIVSFKSTQSFLSQQLESQTNDAATSLGLSLAPFVERYDIAGIQATANAIFDPGFYELVEVLDYDGGMLMSNTQQAVIPNVPGWFTNVLRLQAPSASAEIIGGGQIIGNISITAHPGYAYTQLWEISIRNFMWFLSAAILLILLGNMALRRLLVPLLNVEQQAEAICSRNYDLQIPLPKTRELLPVVTAMNKMTTRVKTVFDEQSKAASRFRQMAYFDALTGLANQRYFKAQLGSHLQEGDKFVPGALFLVQISDMAGFNTRQGYQKGDEVLLKMAKLIRRLENRYPSTFSGRISGGDFGLFIANIDTDAAKQIAKKLSKSFDKLYLDSSYDRENVASTGLLMLERMQDPGMVLSAADEALRIAQAKGTNCWQLFQGDLVAAASGRHSWLKHLITKVKQGDIALLQQNVLHNHRNGEIIHAEILVRVDDEKGEACAAGMFMPSVEQMELSQKVDRTVIDKLIVFLVNNNLEHSPNFAINISESSLLDASFLEWIYSSLKKLPTPSKSHDQHSKLVFEFSEAIAVNNLEILQNFAREVNALGYGIGLDQFGHGRSSYGYLKTLRPEYVKIDSAFTRKLHSHLEKQFFIGTLSNICRNLDIKIIAQAVESEALLYMLKALHIDGVQGFAIHRPQPLGKTLLPIAGAENDRSTKAVTAFEAQASASPTPAL